jgi:hypothetical protein
MENLEWKAVFYNDLETNIEVTKCGRVRKVRKNWYGNHTSKYGEVDFSKLKLHPKGYKYLGIQIKGLKHKTVQVQQLVAAAFLNYKWQGWKLVVDHIDSNKENNSLDNLRIVTNRENVSKEKTLKKGLPTGVYFIKDIKRYRTLIQINGKLKHLGFYNTIEEASEAYQNKLKEITV